MSESFEDNSRMNDFIKVHSYDNPESLLLRFHSKDLGFSLREAIVQIDCRQRTRRKLSIFTTKENFRFPTSLSAEQATHQNVAAYHAYLIGSHHSVADLTAGLGIDAIVFAINGNKVTAIELDSQRAYFLEHNSSLWKPEILSAGGELSVVCANSLDWLKGCDRNFDTIYVDPARRDGNLKRVFILGECTPDVVSAKKLIIDHAKRIFLKTSPLLDIKRSLEELPEITDIKVICINGECKEVLLIINKSCCGQRVSMEAVDLRENLCGTVEYISRFECADSDCNVHGPVATKEAIVNSGWIYDPNAAIHKLRPGKMLCDTYEGMSQLGLNTDLFIAPTLYPEFPGRIFKIDKIAEKSDLKALRESRMEVISRNYPVSASDIKKKLKLKGSSNRFLIASRTGMEQDPKTFICTKITI